MYATGSIYFDESIPAPHRTFSVSCEFERVPPEEHSCWLPLVDRSAVLCHHFPVPRRADEQGLEIPLQILCGMADIRHAVEFKGGVVMKGPYSMLVPINREDDIVQWHLVYGFDEG